MPLFCFIFVAMTLNELASAVQNNIVNGLKGTDSFSHSLEQIKDEVIALRNSLVEMQAQRDAAFKPAEHAQSISCIKMECMSPEDCCHPCGKGSVLGFKHPKLLVIKYHSPVVYLGTANHRQPFKVYLDHNYIYHESRLFGDRKQPYAWTDLSPDKDNLIRTLVFFPHEERETLIATLTAIFENPLDLRRYDCCKGIDVNIGDKMANDIISNLTARYVPLYSRIPVPQPNNGAAIAH